MRLPVPEVGCEVEWVAEHLAGVCRDRPHRSSRWTGTQVAADAALDAFDVTGYARTRNEVWPPARRGASGLSPWIRHGLLTLPRVHAAVDGPAEDRRKFRDELRWQEYARHLYARLGSATGAPLRRLPMSQLGPGDGSGVEAGWDRSMRCVGENLDELERDGWLVNQTRMWLASEWSVRRGVDWRAGEDLFFAHLLDGSRAANRLGWQWTIGAGTSKVYGFSRSQVRRRAPDLCASCAHRHDCPIEDWPDDPEFDHIEPDPRLRHDPDPSATAGPRRVDRRSDPDTVWLTAESLGDDDPALAAHPDLPVVFVFDHSLLDRLRLSSKRLVFLVDRLAELGRQRPVDVHLGDPGEVLAGRALATTFTPVPGWRRLARFLSMAEVHPWPWLERPRGGSLASFSAWSRSR
ncbi:MAG: deoxyribodipyrimidine photolyase [Acidimicrobiia bacterium]|nr:deoxyribodipyrimidine photolyase [Acidimicrobiia bacterium]